MSEPISRAQLFKPYSALTEYQVWMINVLVEKNPDPQDVEGSLNNLLDDIEGKFASASERDAISSIANAAVEVAQAIAHLPSIHRSMEARRRVKRWFQDVPGGLSDHDDDEPELIVLPQRNKRRDEDQEL